MDDRDVTQAIISIKEDISSLRTDVKAVFKRLDEQRDNDKTVSSIQIALTRIEEKFDAMLLKIDDHEKRFKALESKPAKILWVFASGAVGAAAAAIVGWLAGG